MKKTTKMMQIRFLFLISLVAAALVGCSGDDPENAATPSPDKEEGAPVVAQAPSEVLYQVNPRSYATEGCLNAVKARMAEFKASGATVLWLMPSLQPGELKAFGSPYCIRDFRTINSRYGTNADLDEFVKEAHAQGMLVILDWIANHTAWDHDWISSHPEYYRKDASGNIAQASTWTDVAQLDFNNAATRKAMTEDMVYWVKEHGIDGFRCDYADGPSHQFWQEAIAAIRAVNPKAYMLAESSDYKHLDDGFDEIYGWRYADYLTKLFTGKQSPTQFLANAADEMSKVPEGKGIMHYVINHDTAAENAPSSIFGSADALPAAYCLTAMLDGTPMIYTLMETTSAGQKLSFFDYKVLTRNAELAAKYAAVNGAFRLTAPVRAAKPVQYQAGDAVMFSKASGDNMAVVIVNPTREQVQVKTPMAVSGLEMTELISGVKAKLPAGVTIPAYGYAIMGMKTKRAKG